MSETPSHTALIESASVGGVEARKRHLLKNGPRESGWDYSNIFDAGRRPDPGHLQPGFLFAVDPEV